MYRLLPLAVAIVCFAGAIAIPAPSFHETQVPAKALARAPVASQSLDLGLEVTREVMHSTGGDATFAPDVRKAVLEVVERYVELGSLEPIRTGRIGRGLDKLFAPLAFARAADRDRGVVFDEHLPTDSGARPRRTEVALTGLARPDGVPAVVVARLALEIGGRSGMRVERSAEFTLIHDGDRWVIDSYTVRVVRQMPPDEPSEQAEAAYRWEPDRPLFLLALGSDERAGLVGRRADAIHLIGVNAAAGKATILNFPRDTWVNVPGRGPSRINEAFNYGGPELQARTIAEVTGVSPRAVFVTTFAGMPAMVEALGGLIVNVEQRHADANSGAFFEPGANFFRGHHALSYARNRHIKDGDHARTANQANLIIAALAKLRGDGVSAASTAFYLSILMRHTEVHGAGVVDLFRLARVGLALDPANVRNVTVPADAGFVGRASVLFMVAPAAEILADFRDDAVLQQF